MAAVNGTLYLLYVDIGGTSTLLGGQRNLTIRETRNAVDASDKSSANYVGLYGRYEAEVSFEGLVVVSDAAQLALKSALRNGTAVTIKKYYNGSSEATASALVTSIQEAYGDQNVATFNVDLKITGAWS